MTFSLSMQVFATVIFALAVCHTFLTKKILDWSHRFEKGSATESLLHLAGEIEVVFGLWVVVLFAVLAVWAGPQAVLQYQEGLRYIEPVFVFCIMVIASTKPVLYAAERLLETISQRLSKIFSIPQVFTDFFCILFFGPLLGSFITEPAAMTVSALLLYTMVKKTPMKLMYALLAVLFVNISIGGALTPYAAPPILMVAAKWGWDFNYVFTHLGWHAILGCFINSVAFVWIFRKQIKESCVSLAYNDNSPKTRVPLWVVLAHLLLVAVLVVVGHYQNSVMGVFLLFLGLTTVTKKYQSTLRLKEGLLVAFFLGGIMVFGPFQKWWLAPLLSTLGDLPMFIGATLLTAVTDNAALTFLGAQVETLTESTKYFLVAGAITGGGLTIIANAPNAAGYSLLQSKFPEGLNPLQLFIYALPPTLVAFVVFGLL